MHVGAQSKMDDVDILRPDARRHNETPLSWNEIHKTRTGTDHTSRGMDSKIGDNRTRRFVARRLKLQLQPVAQRANAVCKCEPIDHDGASFRVVAVSARSSAPGGDNLPFQVGATDQSFWHLSLSSSGSAHRAPRSG
jgi:hypothetical protein